MENQLARALVAGEFRPGDRVTADADLASGTLVFSTEGATVVGEAGRRDARRRPDDELAPVGGGDSPVLTARPPADASQARRRRAGQLARAGGGSSIACASTTPRSDWRRLPDPLPEPAAVMMPVLLGGSELRPPRIPPPGRAGRPAAVLVLLYPDDRGRGPRRPHRADVRGRPPLGRSQLPGRQDRTGGCRPRPRRRCGRRTKRSRSTRSAPASASSDGSIGCGSRSAISRSRPIVALAERRPTLIPSPFEVARIVEPPVARFLPDAPITMVERTIRDWPLRYGSYDLDGLSVWGATARILSQLGAVLAPAVDERPSPEARSRH